MKKTSKELADFYGIKVGDEVNVFNDDGTIYGIFLVKDLEERCPLQVIHCPREPYVKAMDVYHIGDKNYEIIKPKKKYGDLKCKDFYSCNECPLQVFSCGNVADNTLYGVLEETCIKHRYDINHPIYKAFKAELDKEVE